MRNRLDKVVGGDYQVFGLDYLKALILIARRYTLGNIRYLDNIAVGSRVAVAAEVGVSKRKRPLRASADGFIGYIRAVELDLVQNVTAVGCKRVAHALAALDGGNGSLVYRTALAVDHVGINVFIGRSFVGVYRADHERAEALDRSDNAVLGHDARNGLYLVYRAVGLERVVIYGERDAGRCILKALGEAETDLHITALRNVLNNAAKVEIYLIRRALLYIAGFELGVLQKLILHSGRLALARLVDYEHELTALPTGYGLAVLVFESVERHILRSDELRLAEYLHIKSAVVKDLGANYLFHLERELTRLGHFFALLSHEVRGYEVIDFAIMSVILARRERKRELVVCLVPNEILYLAMLLKVAALARYRKTDGLAVVDLDKLFAVFERDLDRVERHYHSRSAGCYLFDIRRRNKTSVALVCKYRADSRYMRIGKIFGNVSIHRTVRRIIYNRKLRLIYRKIEVEDRIFIYKTRSVLHVVLIKLRHAEPIRPLILFRSSSVSEVFALIHKRHAVFALIADAEDKRGFFYSVVGIDKGIVSELRLTDLGFVLEQETACILFDTVIERAQSGIFELEPDEDITPSSK